MINIADFFKDQKNLVFYQMVISYAILVAALHYFSFQGNKILIAVMLLGGMYIAAQRFLCKRIVFNKILFYTSLSFLLYACLQSPVFPVEQWKAEAAYFVLKFGFLSALLVFFYKRGWCNLFSYIVLVAFFVDSHIIYLINNGITKTRTEYYSILESVLILLLLSSFFEGRQKYRPTIGGSSASSVVLVLYTIGHLANYWAAGFAKMNLNGGVFSWLANETMANLKRAELWDLPMALYAKYIFALDYLKEIEILGNVFVYTIQAASLIVPFFPIILAPLTFFYDIFHLLVGFMAGVFFYKWIYVNVLILLRCDEITQAIKAYGLLQKAVLSGVILFLYYFSSVVPLGWYETRQGNLINAYGIYEDGREVKLHTQFFGSGSFYITNKPNDAFERDHLVQMGAIDSETAILARTCSVPLHENHNYLIERKRIEEFASRFLEERSGISKFMIYVQPYHLLLPHWRNKNTMMGEALHKIRFELKNYCVDENYDVYHEELVDSFIVERRKN